MRIGIDFDNTIVCYDALFHQIATESDLLTRGVPANKVAVRNALRASGRDEAWTRLQGQVYGARMREAVPYEGVLDFLQWVSEKGHVVFIISHRTRHPVLGPPYDLHSAGRSWIDFCLRVEDRRLVPEAQVFFEAEKAAKVERIRACRCDCFVDDLPEILQTESFPAHTERILFDPSGTHPVLPPLIAVRHWNEISRWIRDRCPTKI